jgi:hypothetical protein
VETQMRGENGILFVDISHGFEIFNQAICGIQNKIINLHMPLRLIRMVKINVGLPSL